MKAPFFNDSLLHHPSFWQNRDGFEWREVETFERSLTIDGSRRGRSAAYFIWKDVAGHEYPMFLTDMAHLLGNASVEFGTVYDGMWKVVKRGQNYGIRLVDG